MTAGASWSSTSPPFGKRRLVLHGAGSARPPLVLHQAVVDPGDAGASPGSTIVCSICASSKLSVCRPNRSTSRMISAISRPTLGRRARVSAVGDEAPHQLPAQFLDGVRGRGVLPAVQISSTISIVIDPPALESTTAVVSVCRNSEC